MTDTSSEPTYDTALVAIHGIGNQPPGAFLRSIASGVLEVLTDAGVDAQLDCAVLERTVDAPPHIELTAGNTRSLLVEAHWADVLPKEKFVSVAKWLLVVAPFTVIGLVRDLPRRYREQRSFGRLAAALWLPPAILGRVVLGAILFPVWFSPLLALIAVAGLLPGQAGAAVLGRIQGFISSALGDSFRFVSDPVVREQVLTRVSGDFAWASARAKQIVCVGHSQGAHIAVTTLGAMPEQEKSVRELWTWGSGYRKLLELEMITNSGPAAAARGVFAVLVLPLAAALGYLAGGWLVLVAVGVLALGVLGWWIFRVAPTLRVSEDQVGSALPADLQWQDLWATHDIVPDGRLPGSRSQSKPVVNRRSPIFDHSSYATNAEEVIIPITQMLAPEAALVIPDREELADVRRIWWWSYRALAVIGASAGLLTIVIHGLGSSALTLMTIGSLLLWARLELTWRLRFRRRAAAGVSANSDSRWLATSTSRGDFKLITGCAAIGILASAWLGSREVPLDDLKPWSFRWLSFDFAAVLSTLGVLAGVAAAYLVLRRRMVT